MELRAPPRTCHTTQDKELRERFFETELTLPPPPSEKEASKPPRRRSSATRNGEGKAKVNSKDKEKRGGGGPNWLKNPSALPRLPKEQSVSSQKCDGPREPPARLRVRREQPG